MSNTKHIEIFIEASVLELGSIITPDMFDLHTEVSGSPSGKSSEDFLHFIFVSDDMHPCVTRIVINYDKAI